MERTGGLGLKPRVLYISHGHPELIPGGAEVYALELFKGVRAHGKFKPFLVSRIASSTHMGTPYGGLEDHADQLLIHGPPESFDYFLQSQNDKSLVYIYFRDLLRAVRPDVVHFQHTLHLGVEFIQAVRRVLRDTPIVYTLHEFIAICFADGQMLQTFDRARCDGASPRKCHECFPSVPPAAFRMREIFLKAHLNLVDQFIAPSQFLCDKYVAWGLPKDRIRVLDYGRRIQTEAPPRDVDRDQSRGVFGFLGRSIRIRVCWSCWRR